MDKNLEKELLQQAESISNFGIFELNLKNNSFYWSDGVFKLCGYEPQEFEVTYEKGLAVIHPDDQEEAIQHIQNTIKTGEPYEVKLRFVSKDKSIKHINSKARLIKNHDGTPIKLCGVFQDISDTIKLEDEINSTLAELKARNQFIETILQNLPIGIAVNKIDTGEATIVNGEFGQAYGWPNNDLTDVNSFFKNIYPDEKYRAEMMEKIIGDIQSGDPKKMNWSGIKVTSSSGEEKFVDAKNIPLYDQNLMISTVLDVTEKTLLEEKKSELSADLKALVENTPDIIYSIDLDFKLLTYNSAFEGFVKKLGLGKVSKGINVFDLYSNEKRELYSAVFLIVKEGKRYVFEDEIIIGGHSVFFEVAVNPIQNELNEVIGVSIFSKDITEKNLKEKELSSIKNNQDYIINGTTDLIWSINSKMELITANTAFHKMIERESGKRIKDGDYIIVPDFSEEINKIWFDFYQRGLKGESFTEDYYDEIKGKPNYNLVSIAPMFNDKQEVWGIACFSKNITKEKLNFLELEKKEAELNKIMNSSLDVICTFNKKNEFVKVNEACERIWGYKPEELIGKNHNLLVHPDDINLTNTTTKDIQGGLNVFNFENRNVKKDGTIIPMLWSATYDDEEKLTYCVAKDVTEIKKTEEKLKLSEQYFKNLIQNGGDLVGILNVEGDYIYVSTNSHTILGISSDELIGKNCFSFMHPDDKDNIEEDFNKLVTSKKVQFEPFRFKHNDGSWLWLEAIGSNLLNDEAVNGIVINARDITEKVKKDKELKRTNDVLKNALKITKMGNWEYNIATDELFWSDEVYEILEIDKKNFERITFTDFGNFIHPDDVNEVIEAKNNTIEKGEILNFQHRILTESKKEKYVKELGEKVFNQETKSYWLYGTIRDNTEAIINQNRIEESEKKYKYLFDNNPSAMFIYDFNTLKITDCNNEALELYGYTKKEFLKLTVRDIRPPEDIELINKITESEETYGQIHKSIWRHKKKNGDIIFVNVNGHLIDFNSRRSSLVQITDITEKLRTEEAIKVSDNQRELIMNAALDAIICIDKTGKVTFWNPQAERIFGWFSEEVIGKSLTQLIVPKNYRNAHDAGMKHYQKTNHGPVLNKLLEQSAINKDGKEFPIELTVIPIGKGDNEFFCSFIRDISIRKTYEQELKDSEEKYKLLFNNSPLPKWIYDLEEYRFIDVNNTAIIHYGYTKQEFINMSLKDIRPEEDIPKLLEVQKNVKNRDGVITFGIFNHLKKDKSIIKVEVSGQRIFYQGKNCMMAVCNDVTEREKAFEQLKDKEIKLLKAQKIAKLGYWQLNLILNQPFWSTEVYNIWERNIQDGEPDFESFIASIHSDDRKNFLQQQSETILNNAPFDIEHRIILPNKELKWVHQKGKLIIDDTGKPIYLEGTVQDITKEKLLALSIIESNQRYEYVTKATFDAIWDWDLTTDLIYWGKGFNTIFGYTDAEIEADITSWTNRIHPDDYQRVVKGIHDCINSSEIDDNWTDEYRFLKSDGSYAFVLDKGIIVRNDAKEAIRMIGALQDITKKKEEDLRLQLLESVVTNTKDSVIITEAEPLDDSGPRILYVNEAFTRMTGYFPEEVIGKTPAILQGPKSNKNELAKLSLALRNWESCEITTVNYKKNGDEFYVNFSVSPVADSKGWYTHWIALERDVTESVLAQQKLLSSYEERNTILESIDDGFFATDKNSIVTYWNKKAELLLGATREEVLGRNLHEMFANPNSMAFHDHYQLAIKENKTLHFEEYSERSKKWFEVSAFASENGLSVYFKDITQKKQAESELIELNKTLLKQTKELSTSNQELEQFAYVASHDLQEPLRMITSFLAQIEKKYANTIDEKGKQYIFFAIDGAKRMRQIILDLLEFSRIGKQLENLENIDIDDLVKEIQSLYRKQIEESSASFEYEILPNVNSYKTPIRQVLQNLISNALKYYNPKTPLIINIEVKEVDKFWQFSIKDNGLGIDKEYHQKIFVIFQRLHNKDEYSGTGMGLSICKKIVESLGGDIWVESEEGKGSNFYFTILKN